MSNQTCKTSRNIWRIRRQCLTQRFENLEMKSNCRVNKLLVMRVSIGKKHGSSMLLLENIVFSTLEYYF